MTPPWMFSNTTGGRSRSFKDRADARASDLRIHAASLGYGRYFGINVRSTRRVCRAPSHELYRYLRFACSFRRSSHRRLARLSARSLRFCRLGRGNGRRAGLESALTGFDRYGRRCDFFRDAQPFDARARSFAGLACRGSEFPVGQSVNGQSNGFNLDGTMCRFAHRIYRPFLQRNRGCHQSERCRASKRDSRPRTHACDDAHHGTGDCRGA